MAAEREQVSIYANASSLACQRAIAGPCVGWPAPSSICCPTFIIGIVRLLGTTITQGLAGLCRYGSIQSLGSSGKGGPNMALVCSSRVRWHRRSPNRNQVFLGYYACGRCSPRDSRPHP